MITLNLEASVEGQLRHLDKYCQEMVILNF